MARRCPCCHLSLRPGRPLLPRSKGTDIDAPLLSLEQVTVAVAGRRLVAGLDLALPPGRRLVLVGPNGSGKTSLLRVIAGLDAPVGGRVRRPPSPPGMVFQDGGLWPHMSVEAHLRFADARGDAAWRDRLLQTFRLSSLSRRRPDALSGGERVRLALARALAGRPAWVLLDEPLAHLDAEVRAEVRELLPAALDELDAAAIIVTHQVDDVLLFGTELLCLLGDGGWWHGPAALAVESPPNAVLAAASERGTLLRGRADPRGRVDFGLGLELDGKAPGAEVAAFLDAASVRIASDGGPALPGAFVAPDLRGGSWLRVEGRLLRSADAAGALRPGDAVGVRMIGRPRALEGGRVA